MVGVGQLCPPLTTVTWRNASVPVKSCSTTSVSPVLPGTSVVARQRAAGPATPFRRNISWTVKNGKVCSDGISCWVKGGR